MENGDGRSDADSGDIREQSAAGLARFSSRRVLVGALVLIALGAAYELIGRRSLGGALSLTGAGLVAIINFRWLEALVGRVVQPGEPSFEPGSVLQLLGRLLLLGLLLAAVAWLPGVEGAAVALGISTVVVSMLAEAIRWARIGGG